MSDTRAAIRELRSLGEKRSTQGLTEQEQSRLAELRERLGLPSEPADGRSGGPRPGGALPAAAPASPRAAPNVPTPAMPPPPVGAVALPRLEAPASPAPLPSFANLAAVQPALQPELARAHTGALPVLDQGISESPDAALVSGGALADFDAAADATAEPLPEGDAVLESSQASFEPGVDAPPQQSLALAEPGSDALDAPMPGADGAFDPTQALPEDAPDPPGELLQPAGGAFDASSTLPELAPDDLGAQPADGAFDASSTLPELAPDDLGAQPADGAFDASSTLPELAPDDLGATLPGDETFEPSRTLSELAPDDLGAQPADGAFDASSTLSELAPDDLGATLPGDGTFEPSRTLPELAPDDLGAQPADGAFDASSTLSELAPDDLGATLPGDGTFEPSRTLPELAPDDLGAQPADGAFDASSTLPELAPDDLGAQPADGAFDASSTLPELAPDDLGAQPADGAFDASSTLPELAPDDLGAQPADGAFDASSTLPELAPDDLGAQPADGAFDASSTLPELAPDDLGAIPQGDAALEPSQAFTDLADALPAEPADGAEPLTGAPAADAAEPWTQSAATAESPAGEPPPAPRRSSLAERIDAAVGPPDIEAATPEEAQSWGATREPILLVEGMQTDPGAEAASDTFSPADLGAIPLDVADPATEGGFGDSGGPVELSSADVMLLEGESTRDPDLGGEPADPVQLAALHEFVGEQPFDPRALAFDDEGDESSLVPEDLVGTGAELANAAHAFHSAGDEPSLEPEPAPPPAPTAPRIAVPRPPPSRPAPVPQPPPTPRAPAVPPRPPPAAVGSDAEVRKVPTISAAQPESPRGGFGRSGPFARPPAVLMGPARLDVMDEGTDEGMDETLGVQQPAAAPPVTDVATGAEVFGGAYLNPTFVEGEHRVVLHTLEGQVRRGTVKDLDLLDAVIRLAQPGRAPEAIAAERVKAIFFMQEPGATPLPSAGRRIRVGFADGRQIVGFSEDVDSGEQGFFLVPADTRTHTARIYVFRAGVQSISAA